MKALKVALMATAFTSLLTSGCSQQTLPVLKTGKPKLDYRLGDELFKDQWTISPETKPDVLTVFVPEGKKLKVTFISDLGQISFDVGVGENRDFNVVMGDKVCWTRITGIKFVPAAIYDEAFKQAHRGKSEVTIPEVYELMNIAIGLTDYAKQNRWLVVTDTEYGKEMLAWFESFRTDLFVKELSNKLLQDGSAYNSLKMNANAFVFDTSGNIVPRKEYTRCGQPDEKTNTLEPYLDGLSKFAKASRFREFYKNHAEFYRSQCAFYEMDVDVAGMCRWLEKQFPKSPKFDFIDVVFSPLVGGNQSTTWFESNGFRTLQPHVNYPYPNKVLNTTGLSPEGAALVKSIILFTEVNHGYLFPACSENLDAILAATSHSANWLTPRMQSNYQGRWLYDEYMNWGLIPLWASDIVPAEADKINELVITAMKDRGFTQFDGFQRHLLQLYKSRKPGQTVYDLYPQIIKWFAERN